MADERRDPALEAYREVRRLPDDARARLWQRIQSSVSAGEVGPRLAPEPTQPVRRRAWVAAAVVCAAAVLILALIDGRVLGRSQRRADQQAPHMAGTPQRHQAQPRSGGVAGTRARAEARADAEEGVETDAEAATGVDEAAEESKAEPMRPVGPKTRRQKPKALPNSTLAAELELLDPAKRALEDGQAGDALDLLERHGARYPKGQLREDRMALRVHVLCALGKGPQARGEAMVFAKEFPRSDHLPRVRAACRDRGR